MTFRVPEVEQVKAAHEDALTLGGGIRGVRDENALESALNAPLQRAYYEPETPLNVLVALLMERMILNHPFSDGNKRTAILVTNTTLQLNGYELAGGPAMVQEIEDLAVSVADHGASVDEIASFLRRRMRRLA